jgi:hypothetical protein
VKVRTEGASDDAYEEFEKLGADALRPTRDDYELLFEDIHTAAYEALRYDPERAMNELLELAWREPNRIHEGYVEIGELGVGVILFESGEYRVAILPAVDDRKRPISDDILELLLRVVFGEDCRLDQLEPADRGMLDSIGYELRPTDLTFAQLRDRTPRRG